MAIASGRLTLIHFGDIHFWRIGLDLDFYPKRFLGLANLMVNRRRMFPAAAARACAERLGGERADYMLFSGDAATTSLRGEFLDARGALTPLFERWGERLIAIPGNHDRYTPRATRGRLFEELFLRKEQVYPFARQLSEQFSLIGFDCSVPRLVLSNGNVTEGQMTALRAELARERAAGRRLIVMGHYPLVYPAAIRIKGDHALAGDQRRALLELLLEFNVAVYLHGHKHNRWAGRTGNLIHLNCGSAGMVRGGRDRRPGYLKLRMAEAGDPEIEAHWLAPENQWRTEVMTPEECPMSF